MIKMIAIARPMAPTSRRAPFPTGTPGAQTRTLALSSPTARPTPSLTPPNPKTNGTTRMTTSGALKPGAR